MLRNTFITKTEDPLRCITSSSVNQEYMLRTLHSLHPWDNIPSKVRCHLPGNDPLANEMCHNKTRSTEYWKWQLLCNYEYLFLLKYLNESIKMIIKIHCYWGCIRLSYAFKTLLANISFARFWINMKIVLSIFLFLV